MRQVFEISESLRLVVFQPSHNLDYAWRNGYVFALPTMKHYKQTVRMSVLQMQGVSMRSEMPYYQLKEQNLCQDLFEIFSIDDRIRSTENFRYSVSILETGP